MVTLRQLHYFEALSDAAHFGHAAEACAVTQPALSMQVKELEGLLGVSLIERRRSGVELTEEGMEVARRARTILAAVRDLEDYARHRTATLSGPLRFGAIPSIAPYVLPVVLPAIQDAYPEIELQLRETITETLMEALAKGGLDLVLLALPVEHPDIETVPLFDDKFLLAARRGTHAPGTPITAESVSHERLLLLEEGHCLRDQALAYCHLVSPEARGGFGASSLSTIVQMVANGYGVTLLPEIAAISEIHRDIGIDLLPFDTPAPTRTVGLAWRKTSPRKASFRDLGELIRSVMEARLTHHRARDTAA